MTTVFVYGSLMSGLYNHRRLETDGARFVREASTEASFTLVDLGAFPGLIAAGSTSVCGEVYDVDDATLASLDELEGHPRFYCRTPIRLATGEEVQAYLLPAIYRRHPEIAGGDWRRGGVR